MGSIGNFLKEHLSRKLNVFLVCLFISAIIWVLIALSKRYSSDISFPITYHGLPEDRIVTDPFPQSFDLKVRSHGFKLLSYKLFSRQDPVNIDMEELRYLNKKKRNEAYLPTEELLENLSKQFPEKTRIRDVDPDTLFVTLTSLQKKKVKVVPDLTLDFKEQYRLADEVRVQPSKVTLNGPSALLDTIEKIHTRPLRLKKLQEDHSQTVAIQTDSISKKLQAEPFEVEIHIQVDKFTEGKVRIPVIPKKVPEKYSIKSYPDSVTVHYLVGFENYEKVEAGMFKGVIVFPSQKGMNQKEHLQVELRDRPSFIDIVRKEPRQVEFIIRKEE